VETGELSFYVFLELNEMISCHYKKQGVLYVEQLLLGCMAAISSKQIPLLHFWKTVHLTLFLLISEGLQYYR